MRKNWKRVHRLVVLPDYQGIGIGTKFIKAIAKMITAKGCEINLTTTTPSLIHALLKDNEWILIRYGRADDSTGWERYKNTKNKHLDKTTSMKRITYSFNYKR